MLNQRRTFMARAAGAAASLFFSTSGLAQSGAPLGERDPRAIARGYKTDELKVDKAQRRFGKPHA